MTDEKLKTEKEHLNYAEHLKKAYTEHLKKVYTAYYSQIDFTKDFCEQNIKHITHIQKQPTYCNTPLFKFDGKTTALVYALYSVSTICKDLLEHIENEIVKLSEVEND